MTAYVDVGYYAATIAGNPANCAAWQFLNLGELLGLPTVGGANEEIASAHGELGREHWEQARRLDLRFLLQGNVTPAGVPIADAAAGLDTNKELFEAAFYGQPRDDGWCVDVVVPKLNGTVCAGKMQVHPPQWGEGDEFEIAGAMTVVIPRGRLLPVPPEEP